MIIATASALAAATIFAAWVIERKAHHRTQRLAEQYRQDNLGLSKANDFFAEELAKKQLEIEALEELQEIDVIQHLESTAQVTDYNGLPVYTWSLSSPYPTLAEAVRHVPARR